MISYIAPMVFSQMDFIKLLKSDLSEFMKNLESNRVALKEISGYYYDNSHYRFTNGYGEEFTFQINEASTWNNKTRSYDKLGIFSINVWDYIGLNEIFKGTIPQNDRQDFINEMMEASTKWSHGEKRCNDCGKWINYKENISHRYFAGVYCLDCWVRKWKAVEAAENYN